MDAIKYAFVESVRMSGMDSETRQGLTHSWFDADGLESMRQVSSRAIAVTDDSAEERMDARIDSIRQSLATTGGQLADKLQATSERLEQISEQRALAPPEQKVLVQHKVPRVLADLVKGQFHLMQEWLRPLLEESLDNGRDLGELKSQLEAMLENYQRVEDSFNAGTGNKPQ